MTPTLTDIDLIARHEGLEVFGAFHPDANDTSAGGAATIVLLGPTRGFWDVLTAWDGFGGGPDPVDRWSHYIITRLAAELDAQAIFPFGGPPYAPFIGWAKQTGRAWASPVGMLVHDTTGLLVSYRGALAFRQRLDLPPQTHVRPCDTCTGKPCLTACPVGALGADGYEVASCHAFLNSNAGQDCMSRGCAVRRSCPVSAGAHRSDAQSAHHMRAFRDSN